MRWMLEIVGDGLYTAAFLGRRAEAKFLSSGGSLMSGLAVDSCVRRLASRVEDPLPGGDAVSEGIAVVFTWWWSTLSWRVTK